MVFSVGDNISDTGNMRFVASKLESIKKSIEKYKRAKTELSYTDIWGAFGNMMDYIQFFNMGTAKSILKKSANDWLGTNHELSKSGDSIKRKHVHELKRIFQILLDHQGLKVLGTVNVIVDEVCGEGTTEHDIIQLLDDDSREESGSGTYYERECDALFDIDGRGNTERLVTRNPKLRNLLEDGEYIPSLGQLNLNGPLYGRTKQSIHLCFGISPLLDVVLVQY